jgi:hypothetical protein
MIKGLGGYYLLINLNMKFNKKILLLSLSATILLFVACDRSDVPDDSLMSTDESGVIFALDANYYDWGGINIEGGKVDKGFHFRNDGDEDLVLKGMRTSCMCTTAYVELPDGSISPTFGMHGESDWTYNVKPGEEFEVEVTFDPMAHGPDAVGMIRRSVMLNTSDGDVELQVQADVLSDEDYQKKYDDVNFVFEELEFDFGVVKQSAGIISHDFEFEYLGSDAISVTAVPTSCACTSASISRNDFERGDRGVVTVEFDPNLHEEPDGRFFKTVTLLTEPELEKQPEVKIWAEMDLDLGPEAYKLKQHNE